MQSSFYTSCLKIKKSYCGSGSGEWFYKFVEIYKFPISAFSFHTFSGGNLIAHHASREIDLFISLVSRGKHRICKLACPSRFT